MLQFRVSKGFSLLVVLIFLQIFAIMSLYGLTTVGIIIKMNQDNWQRDITISQARNILFSLTAVDDLNCTIPITSPSILSKQPLSWWQQTACGGNSAGNQYYYVVEALGRNACSAVNDDEHLYLADYYRVTVLFSSIRLQGTYVKASNEIPSCHTLHYAITGYQMWREI